MVGERKKSNKNLSTFKLVKKELSKDKFEKKIIGALFLVTALTVCTLFIFLISNLSLTGYSSYVESQAGDITELTLYRNFDTSYWAGVYGLALRVAGFTELLSRDFPEGDITRQDLFFDCLQSDVLGGPEVYASTSPTIDFDNLVAGDPSEVDIFLDCVGKTECATNTFSETMSVMVGSRNVSGVPSTHTHKFDGDNEIFDLGLMSDGTNFVYVASVKSIQYSYDEDKLVNFQMILPASEGTTPKYYFFTDPYDVCPEGGMGENLAVQLSGYVFDIFGNPISNASVIITGIEVYSNFDGYYGMNFSALAGGHNLIAIKEEYDDYFENITINNSHYIIEKNITLQPETPGQDTLVRPLVFGYVRGETGNFLENVKMMLGNSIIYTDNFGHYSFTPSLKIGNNSIVGIKENYETHYNILEFLESTTSYNYNFTMDLSSLDYEFITGPYTDEPNDGKYDEIPQEVVDAGQDYWISTKEINKEVRQGTFIEDEIGLYNLRGTDLSMTFVVSPSIADFVKVDKMSLTLPPGDSNVLKITIYGNYPVGTYEGKINILGDVEQVIPVKIRIVEKKFSVEVLLMEIDLFKNLVRPGEDLRYKLNLQNLLRNQNYQLDLVARLKGLHDGKVYFEQEFNSEIATSLTLLRDFPIPENISSGDYLLEIDAKYLNLVSTVVASFVISKPIYLYAFFGIPLWVMFLIISFVSFSFLNLFLYKRHKEKKKRYQIKVDYDSLPKSGERVVKLGHIAETKHPAYYDLEKLTTHAIVAGATGMGKSISAQVVIEEALLNGTAVIVFDPTAQWSGMLRKCTDKRMLAYYPKFGMKPTDAQGFKGNVRQVLNPKQIVDIKKYTTPGQIQIFGLNKLQPKDIDIFVANVIRQVFKSDPKESPTLKVLLVFDEVHRLLPKFGGNGEGFLQIERACREFRKWGIGVMLISQVLNDFVGEIKANINTELQTRTLEENDLERIRVKYGEGFLKSLVRAEVGVVMFQNAEYNRGRPYFINFRPILHSTRRLSDEELEKYNKYNDLVDDLEYSVGGLEKEKIDTFDLKMELKLIKDKIMSGSFNVVEIYLEGLGPRVEKEWEKLGKKAPKRQMEMVSDEDIKKANEEAKKEHNKAKEKEAIENYDKEEKNKIEKDIASKDKEEAKPVEGKAIVGKKKVEKVRGEDKAKKKIPPLSPIVEVSRLSAKEAEKEEKKESKEEDGKKVGGEK